MSERIVLSSDNVSTAGGMSQAAVAGTGPIPAGMRLAGSCGTLYAEGKHGVQIRLEGT